MRRRKQRLSMSMSVFRVDKDVIKRYMQHALKAIAYSGVSCELHKAGMARHRTITLQNPITVTGRPHTGFKCDTKPIGERTTKDDVECLSPRTLRKRKTYWMPCSTIWSIVIVLNEQLEQTPRRSTPAQGRPTVHASSSVSCRSSVLKTLMCQRSIEQVPATLRRFDC